MLWRCIGLDLAFSKGARGTTVEWIGVMLTSHPDFVRVTLKQSFLDELRALISNTSKRNLVRLKELRSLAGKANRVATLVYTWRPFLSDLWAAISDILSPNRQSHAPANMCWTRQISDCLHWMLCFLDGVQGCLIRIFLLSSYLHGWHQG